MQPASLAALKPRVPFSQFSSISFRVGTIKGTEAFPKARNPSYKVTVDFGEVLGIKQSVAQLPSNYPEMSDLLKKNVICITNLGERNIAGFKSQVLIVGFPDGNGHVHLLNTRNRCPAAGLPLSTDNGSPKDNVAYQVFSSLDIKAGTIVALKQLETDPTCYSATMDVGNLGKKEAIIIDIDDAIASELLGTQAPVLLNLAGECMRDPEAHVLSFLHEGKKIPLGIDAKVENGVDLF